MLFPPQIPRSFFTKIEKSILKFIWKQKNPQITKAILSKNSNVRGIKVSDFKLYYRPYLKKKQYGTGSETDMWTNGIKGAKINPCRYSCLFLNKDIKNITW
jgi:hypothetical protein